MIGHTAKFSLFALELESERSTLTVKDAQIKDKTRLQDISNFKHELGDIDLAWEKSRLSRLVESKTETRSVSD